MEQSKYNKIIAGAIVIAAVVLIAFAASIFSKPEEAAQNEPTAQSQPSTATADSESTITNADATAYKNGTYVVSDTYSSPGGIEDIKVTLTLEDSTVIDVQVVQEANNDESAEYQQKFQQSYKSKVIGKAISDLELSRSSGASLTTNAFNDALQEIRSQAKA